MEKEIVLSIKDLSISFRGLKAVNNFNLEVKKNELYGLIGPNGAGKTTIFNLITGVYKPTSGYIYLNNKDITKLNEYKTNRLGIARTFQNIRLFNNMSVINNVMIPMHHLKEYKSNLIKAFFYTPSYVRKYNLMRERAKELLKMFNLYDLRNELSSNLSYGQQRKLEIARALASNPTLLLLDEPAAGMNPEETKELMETIKFIRDKFDVTIILIEHDMKLVSGICEKLTVLNFGETLISGNTKEVLSNKEVIKAYLGE